MASLRSLLLLILAAALAATTACTRPSRETLALRSEPGEPHAVPVADPEQDEGAAAFLARVRAIARWAGHEPDAYQVTVGRKAPQGDLEARFVPLRTGTGYFPFRVTSADELWIVWERQEPLTHAQLMIFFRAAVTARERVPGFPAPDRVEASVREGRLHYEVELWPAPDGGRPDPSRAVTVTLAKGSLDVITVTTTSDPLDPFAS
jgi:hypothetical protein